MRTLLVAIVGLLLTACADTSAPTWPAEAELSVRARPSMRLVIPVPTDDRGVHGLVVRVDGAETARLQPDAREHALDELAEGEHRVEVVALDEAGNASTPLEIRVDGPDRTAPRFPADAALSARTVGRSSGPDGGPIALSWPAATDAVAVVTYRVLRDGQEVARVGEASARLERQLGEHTYAVRALDAAGNESEPLETRFAGWYPMLGALGAGSPLAVDPALGGGALRDVEELLGPPPEPEPATPRGGGVAADDGPSVGELRRPGN